MNIDVIYFEQPAGEFLLGIMKASDLIHISKADPRRFDNIKMETIGGIQRDPSWKRIKEIAAYANTVDAAFPTPVLLALEENDYELNGNKLEIKGKYVADIVDGQHRILGLKESNLQEDFTIPVVFILNAKEEQKALIFATINGKQTKVPASIIYSLFEITETRSPKKTAHEIARALNSEPTSPWYRKLKMLGKKTQESETLSQGTFIKFLLPHISKKPDIDMDLIRRGKDPLKHDCIFNDYFFYKKDSMILKIMMNVFQAARNTWPEEWDSTDYILTKTNGFSGIMRALEEMVMFGKRQKNLSIEFFECIFKVVQERLLQEGKQLKSNYFATSAKGEAQIRDMIIDAVKIIEQATIQK